MRIERLFSSISFRVALIFTVLLLISFAVAAMVTTIATRSAALADARARIETEADAIRHEAQTEGLPAAIAAVAARSQRPGALEYRIIDSLGRTLTGDQRLPSSAPGWRRIDTVADGEGGFDDYLIYAEPLAGGAVLLVADNLERAEGVRDSIIHTLALVGAVTAALSLAIGWLATRRVLGRIDSLSNVARQVAGGDLAVRAPQANGMRDDIDAFTDVFNSMLDRVGALVSNIRRVSTDIAHDLRTPLGHLGQQLEKARQATNLDEAKAGIEDAQQSMERVLATFGAVLRLAEIEAGALRARFASIDLSALAERVADAYGPDIETGGRTLRTEIARDVIVRGDDDLLAQAIANLIENAMRHTPSGATIRVSVREDRKGGVVIVEDNGPGIPEEARARVLEPFVRLDESRGRQGAGLGLSIVAAVARLHGARLNLEEAAPGLRVSLTAPLSTGREARI